ncbi:MAG: heme-binding protein [Burkholderiaceae bacterium]|jgi:uncharacterized protein GlcG (DUF336 family)
MKNQKWLYKALGATVLAAAPLAAAAQGTFESSSLTPETALKAAQAALQSCRDQGYQVAVAVTDRSGVPIAMIRDRFAGPHTPETAVRKAYTAASFKMDTTSLAQATQATEAASGIRHLDKVLALGGGLPIEAAGSLVGAIGVSGAPGGDADDACGKVGIDAILVDIEF